ncbi:hypothetical protein FQR65_LT15324 [Abscondita terminalis]|nr:hypothetical protein FQR65_LT15324 [Abscondita terminalis]
MQPICLITMTLRLADSVLISGINFVKDERTAGQIGYNKRLHQSQQNLYGVGIDISRFRPWNKTGYIFKGKPYQSLGWMNQFTYHQQDSFFGLRNYFGKQSTFYSNLIFESIIGNTNHKYKVGASFLLDDYNEDYLTTNYKRQETVPGFFAEYTLTGPKYVLVAGARVDFHNLAGTQFTPRLNFKYDIAPKTILRLSAGRGFRTANIFAESQQYFASNRSIEILSNNGNIYGLKPEIAWNYGLSLQQEFKIFNKKSTIIADVFRTDFQNQVITDLDQYTHKILFYNLEGKSFANSVQELIIKGKVVNQQKQPLEYVSVNLLQNDTIMKQVSITDSKGVFLLKASSGAYLLTLSFMAKNLHSQKLELATDLDLGEITVEETKVLEGVTITARKN